MSPAEKLRLKMEALPPAPPEMTRGGRRVLMVVMILGVLGAGCAFVFKLVEFIYTLGSSEVRGFADVPVTVYFFVAAGWLSILIWCFKTGKFKNLEQAGHDMLAQEEEYERRGE
jgi:nitrogen fixation-related uncharacterized protein